MAKYEKIPVIIDAEQFVLPSDEVQARIKSGERTDKFMQFPIQYGPEGFYLDIETKEGVMRAPVGWWVIRGVEDEFYPCAPSIFAKTYKKVEE